MGYRLAMSGEIRRWLTELCDSDPPAARKAGEALTALMTEGAGLGEPAVIAVPEPLPADPVDALDRCYQLRLEQMNELRRQIAEARQQADGLEQLLPGISATETELHRSTTWAVANGRFGWAVDPEGNRFELWQPAPGH